MKILKDKEAKHVYSAEWEFESTFNHLNMKFLSSNDATVYAKSLLLDHRWKNICNRKNKNQMPRIVFDDTLKEDNLGGCYYGSGIIALDSYNPTKFNLLHEMVHYAGYDLHDANFREAHVQLINVAVGSSASKALSALYIENCS